MTFSDIAIAVPTSIAPFDPTVGVTVVAAVALTIAVAFMTFLALAPIVSETWNERLSAPANGPSVEASEAD